MNTNTNEQTEHCKKAKSSMHLLIFININVLALLSADRERFVVLPFVTIDDRSSPLREEAQEYSVNIYWIFVGFLQRKNASYFFLVFRL